MWPQSQYPPGSGQQLPFGMPHGRNSQELTPQQRHNMPAHVPNHMPAGPNTMPGFPMPNGDSPHAQNHRVNNERLMHQMFQMQIAQRHSSETPPRQNPQMFETKQQVPNYNLGPMMGQRVGQPIMPMAPPPNNKMDVDVTSRNSVPGMLINYPRSAPEGWPNSREGHMMQKQMMREQMFQQPAQQRSNLPPQSPRDMPPPVAREHKCTEQPQPLNVQHLLPQTPTQGEHVLPPTSAQDMKQQWRPEKSEMLPPPFTPENKPTSAMPVLNGTLFDSHNSPDGSAIISPDSTHGKEEAAPPTPLPSMGAVGAPGPALAHRDPKPDDTQLPEQLHSQTSKNGEKPKRRRRKRCGECVPCQVQEDCGNCYVCKNKGQVNAICKARKCMVLRKKAPNSSDDSGSNASSTTMSITSLSDSLAEKQIIMSNSMMPPPPTPPIQHRDSRTHQPTLPNSITSQLPALERKLQHSVQQNPSGLDEVSAMIPRLPVMNNISAIAPAVNSAQSHSSAVSRKMFELPPMPGWGGKRPISTSQPAKLVKQSPQVNKQPSNDLYNVYKHGILQMNERSFVRVNGVRVCKFMSKLLSFDIKESELKSPLVAKPPLNHWEQFVLPEKEEGVPKSTSADSIESLALGTILPTPKSQEPSPTQPLADATSQADLLESKLPARQDRMSSDTEDLQDNVPMRTVPLDHTTVDHAIDSGFSSVPESQQSSSPSPERRSPGSPPRVSFSMLNYESENAQMPAEITTCTALNLGTPLPSQQQNCGTGEQLCNESKAVCDEVAPSAVGPDATTTPQNHHSLNQLNVASTTQELPATQANDLYLVSSENLIVPKVETQTPLDHLNKLNASLPQPKEMINQTPDQAKVKPPPQPESTETEKSDGVDCEKDFLKHNKIADPPPCNCLNRPYDENLDGPYYSHLGVAASVAGVRKLIEDRVGMMGSAVRIEKVRFSGKEGRTSLGCPAAKWIIRRSGLEEKYLTICRQRQGHHCATAWMIIAIVSWEGVPGPAADHMYNYLTRTLPIYGYETERRCGTNQPRDCACQGWDTNRKGASYSFGCSWSVYYNGCKFARSQIPRKFKMRDENFEGVVESKFQALGEHLSPLYRKCAPQSYGGQVRYERQAQDCRLGFRPGRPFSGVTATVDFCAHQHRDTHNMNNGCTVVVTLTKHRGLDKPEDEQLHTLPMYVLENTDEFDSREGLEKKIQSGSVEVLNGYEQLQRRRSKPYRRKKKGTETYQSPKVKAALMSTIQEKLEAEQKQSPLTKPAETSTTSSGADNSKTPTDDPFAAARHQLFKTPEKKDSNQAVQCQQDNMHKNMSGQQTNMQWGLHPPLGNNLFHPAFNGDSMKNHGQQHPVMVHNGQHPSRESQMPLNFNGQHPVMMPGGQRPPPVHGERPPMQPADMPHPAQPQEPSNQADTQLSPTTENSALQQSGTTTVSTSEPQSLATKPEMLTSEPISNPPNMSGQPPLQPSMEQPMEKHSSMTDVQAHQSFNDSLAALSRQFGTDGPLLSENTAAKQISGMINGEQPGSDKETQAKQSESLNTEKDAEDVKNAEAHRLKAELDSLDASVDPLQPPKPRPPSPEYDDPQGRNVFEDNQHLFKDPNVGGVAIALQHGAVLFEVAKRELHATTALRQPDRYNPTRISLVFYQHKRMNYKKHGFQEYLKAEEDRQAARKDAEAKGIEYIPKGLKYKKQRQLAAAGRAGMKKRGMGDIPLVGTGIRKKPGRKPGWKAKKQIRFAAYEYMWPQAHNHAMTMTTTNFISRWMKPECNVTGPYQRWISLNSNKTP